MDRREFLRSAAVNLGALAFGARVSSAGAGIPGDSGQAVSPSHSEIPPLRPGTLREINLTPAPAQFELPTYGVFEKWLYNGQFPGPEIRAQEGERLRITVRNNLPEGTTVHWHGIPLPNPMDGIPNLTQPPIATGGTFLYEFDAAPSGSYLYHSHFGLQPDRGLIGPLIIEEKKSHLDYDREYTLKLSDFLPGAPVRLGVAADGKGGSIGMEVPPYSVLLINGRPPKAPAVFRVKAGERVRMRLINLSGATIYRFAIGGHPMTVVHTDGRPVEPLQADSLYLAPGERYDVLVEAKNPGAWPIAASPDNDLPPALAVLQYSGSNESRPPDGATPEGLMGGRLLLLKDLRGLELPETRKPNRAYNLALAGGGLGSGGMMDSDDPPARMTTVWTINGQAYPKADPLEIAQGEAVRFRLENQSNMPHPMHMHGHFFRVGGVLKDTTIVWPRSGHVDLEFTANNPGSWFFHCHNLYHMEAGMSRVVRYK